jgi:hypothetical protein
MPRARRLLLTAMIPIAAIGLATVGVIASAQDRPSREWLTWGYDRERTGWNKGENTLSPENVSRLELKWKVQLSTKPQDVVLSTPGEARAPSTPLYQSARWGNDDAAFQGEGLWGAMATYEDAQGQRWLYMPLWGPPSKGAAKFKYSYGPAPDGSVMAFRVAVENDRPALSPVWMSRNMQVPDPPVVANGVVFAIQTGENTQQRFFGERGAALGVDPPKMRATPVTNLILYAFDAQTGRELYSSEKIINCWCTSASRWSPGGAFTWFPGTPMFTASD